MNEPDLCLMTNKRHYMTECTQVEIVLKHTKRKRITIRKYGNVGVGIIHQIIADKVR